MHEVSEIFSLSVLSPRLRLYRTPLPPPSPSSSTPPLDSTPQKFIPFQNLPHLSVPTPRVLPSSQTIKAPSIQQLRCRRVLLRPAASITSLNQSRAQRSDTAAGTSMRVDFFSVFVGVLWCCVVYGWGLYIDIGGLPGRRADGGRMVGVGFVGCWNLDVRVRVHVHAVDIITDT